MLNQVILRSRLGKSYRVHSPEYGVLPKGLKPLYFSDRSSAKLFLSSLNVGIDFWRPLIQSHNISSAYGYSNQTLEKVAEYLVQGRLMIVEVPDDKRLAATVQKRSIKLPSGDLIQFFAASEMLTKKGAQKKQFLNQNSAKEFVLKNTESADQLRQILQAADIAFGPLDSEEILSDKIAQAILREELFVSTSKPIARPPEPKSGEAPSAKARPVDLAPPPARTWIEVVLKDDKGEPISGEDFWILDPEGNEHTGKTDGAGMARVDGILSGYCQVAFPNIDGAGIHQCAAGVDCCTPAEEPSEQAESEPNTDASNAEESTSPEVDEASEADTEEALSWSEVELVTDDGSPMANEEFVLTDSAGNEHKGITDGNGYAKIEGIADGVGSLKFPQLGKQN